MKIILPRKFIYPLPIGPYRDWNLAKEIKQEERSDISSINQALPELQLRLPFSTRIISIAYHWGSSSLPIQDA